jgi:hypothetical protein
MDRCQHINKYKVRDDVDNYYECPDCHVFFYGPSRKRDLILPSETTPFDWRAYTTATSWHTSSSMATIYGVVS